MRILQTNEPRTPPYSDHAEGVAARLGRWEKLARRVLPGPVAAALELFRRRNRCDVVVTADYRTSVLYGALTNLLGGRALHVVKELYLDEHTLGSWFRRCVYRWALRGCSCVVTNCSAEVPICSRFLGLPAERFRFLPWASNLPAREAAGDDGSVLAAGRSFRDWPTLFDAARRVDARFAVVAERRAVAGISLPDNVELHCDVTHERYLEFLGRARLVVVPLRPTVRSVGQAALLEAMAWSKPVVTADVPGVADYVRDGDNGALYQAGDSASLAGRIRRLLADADLRKRLGDGGRRAVEACFNRERYARELTRMLAELLQGARGATAAEVEAAAV